MKEGNKIMTESYERKLANISPRQWEAFLKRHSQLPGPMPNLDLAQAFTHVGTLIDYKKFIKRNFNGAPENTPEEFLTFCGVLGLGRYMSEYHDMGLLQMLKDKANDPRQRIREAVTIALLTIGKKKITRLLKYAKIWVGGSYFEQRAAITSLCNSDLLADRNVALEVLELLDWVTASMTEQFSIEEEGFKDLEEALSYCWSIAVAALPEKGKQMMERWIKEDNQIIKKIMRKNLEKERLRLIEPLWTKQWIQRIST